MPEGERYSSGSVVAFIVIGLLLLVPSGLCSGAMGVMAIWASFEQPRSAGDALSVLPMIAIFGGPFIVGGGALLLTGIRRARANRRSESGPS